MKKIPFAASVLILLFMACRVSHRPSNDGQKWYFADIDYSHSDIPPDRGDFHAGISLTVNGKPETTAKVTLVTPDHQLIPVPYTKTYHLGDDPEMAEYETGNLSETYRYQPGGNYVLVAETSAGPASVAGVAPGGIGFIPAHSSVTWSSEGNKDFIIAARSTDGSSISTFGSDIDSPYTIPASLLSVPVTYNVNMQCQTNIDTIRGAVLAPGRNFIIQEHYYFRILP